MKKVLLVSVLGLFLFSCGKSACDCLADTEKLAQEAIDAMGDADKTKEVGEKSLANLEACKDYTEADYKDCAEKDND